MGEQAGALYRRFCFFLWRLNKGRTPNGEKATRRDRLACFSVDLEDKNRQRRVPLAQTASDVLPYITRLPSSCIFTSIPAPCDFSLPA
jgi:hypothetical protein